MAKNKKRIITDKEQRGAASILTEYIIAHNDKGYNAKFVESVMKDYGLFEDPFTRLPCSAKEYANNNREYDRQVMIQKYGHCDGLD